MNFFDSKLWKKIRKNKKIFRIIHNTIGVKARKIGLRDRVKEMKNVGLASIFEIDETLEQCGCDFFVDFGTLLGFIRSGKPMAWDYDIDFGIFLSDYFKWDDLEQRMIEKGFSLSRQFSYQGDVTEQTYRRGNIYVDFFAHFFKDGGSYYYVYYPEEDYQYEDNKHLHARSTTTVKITGCKKLNVEGGVVHVPIEYEQYLEDVYGADWRIPQQNWKPGAFPNVKKLEVLGVLTDFEAKGSN